MVYHWCNFTGGICLKYNHKTNNVEFFKNHKKQFTIKFKEFQESYVAILKNANMWKLSKS